MATGAPGTNGVWQYGEDDSEATFSALLNKAASTTNTQIGLDRGRLTTLEARKLAGLVPIIPPTVNYSGGSATANSLGLITLTNVTSVSLNNVFTSAYRNYRILVTEAYSSAGSTSINFKFRASGVDSTVTSFYGWGSRAGNSGIALRGANAQATLGTDIILNPVSSATYSSISMDLASPQLSQPKSAIWTAHGFDGVTNATSSMSFVFNSGASYDGFTLFPTSNNLYAKVQVFGYNS